MPFSRGKKTSTSSKIPKLHSRVLENQLDAPQSKRSSSPPQGAPKKRTAFENITNAHKIEFSNPIKKKESVKKLQRKVPVLSCNDVKTKLVVSPEETKEVKNVEVKIGKLEESSSKKVIPPHLLAPEIPPEFDIDSENLNDCSSSSEYSKEIFDYLKKREEKFTLQDYMVQQPNLNTNMRAILVDWLVEVQENFELNHETLYLAVKMTDHYLAVSQVKRESLQLIGSTAMLLASKFEERAPPCVDDFLYICDDAYKRSQLIAMEISILQALNFDINIPVPYRFLRRYAKCVNAGMDTLTLARFVCELSLLRMEFVPVRASLLASACLFIALVTKDLCGWTQCLEFHSGYKAEDLAPLVRKLHDMLSSPADSKLAVIRTKVFFEVALIPIANLEKLEGFLK
ncbi:hypothetical protein DNTS_032192 [Danionella cerebrum]|uniref:Uncharacterized protein n=1 Tax=Danionella cerebrum TaxID=2873325 RepID=A0A553PUR2_9TELE|nr:hypothetical protein DNTS_032192 [Danionella translucida]